MRRTAFIFALLVLAIPAYLLGDQRVPARVVATESERTWSFGATTMVLTPDNFANYIENGTVKFRVKCKHM